MSAYRLYTVGHGDRSAKEFLAVLAGHGIRVLVDVRARPGSRRFPHFNGETLRQVLERAGIRYHWAGLHLGGLRTAAADSPHLALDGAFRGYADHMASPLFERAIDDLIVHAARQPLVVMCAERKASQCHRSLIADFLTVYRGIQVVHLASPVDASLHRPRSELNLRRLNAGRLVYDCYSQQRLELEDE